MAMFSYSLVIFVGLATLIPRVALAESPASYTTPEAQVGSCSNPNTTTTAPDSMKLDPFAEQYDEKEMSLRKEYIFRIAFMYERKEHRTLVRSLGNSSIGVVAIMQQALANVAAWGPVFDEMANNFKPGEMNEIMQNRTMKGVLADSLLNIALMSHLMLRFPHETIPLLKSRNWKQTIYWALKFADKTRFLMDSMTGSMFDTLEVALGITKEDLKDVEPYWDLDYLTGKSKKKRRRKTLRYDEL